MPARKRRPVKTADGKSVMTPDDLRKFMTTLDIRSASDLARRTGISRDTASDMLAGNVPIKLTFALACSALAMHLEPWPQPWAAKP